MIVIAAYLPDQYRVRRSFFPGRKKILVEA
jgi:hypothetical protein